MNDTIRKIIDIEWEMFHNVNGEDRVDCQDDKTTFELMRNAQFSAWSDEAAQAYLEDVQQAQKDGRSLVREKYIWMMQNTDPEGFEHFKGDLPEVSEEKNKLVADIWSHMLAQTEKMREKYPLLALGGRPLHASEESEWPSVETYQKGELLTFSNKTLKALLAHIEELEKQGVDLAYKIQENSITCLGYKTMEEAEFAMAEQFMTQMGITVEGGCPTCKAGLEEFEE